MGVRINPAGHDIATVGVNHLVTGQIVPDRGDLAVFDQNVRFICQIGGNNGSATNNHGHGWLLVCLLRKGAGSPAFRLFPQLCRGII